METLEKQEKIYKSPEEAILENGDVKDIARLKGYEYLDFIKIKDDGSGIFKRETRDKKEVKRERAAYLVDLFLGFDFVPPTVLRSVNGENGSLQKFIENARMAYMVEMQDIPKEELLKLGIFDYIINNGDRHKSNYLVRDGKIFAIDNGWAFSYYSNFRDKANWDLITDMVVPQEIKDKLASFVSSESKKRILKDLLLELMDEKYINLMFKRAEAIYKVIEKDGSVSWQALNRLKADKFFK